MKTDINEIHWVIHSNLIRLLEEVVSERATTLRQY